MSAATSIKTFVASIVTYVSSLFAKKVTTTAGPAATVMKPDPTVVNDAAAKLPPVATGVPSATGSGTLTVTAASGAVGTATVGGTAVSAGFASLITKPAGAPAPVAAPAAPAPQGPFDPIKFGLALGYHFPVAGSLSSSFPIAPGWYAVEITNAADTFSVVVTLNGLAVSLSTEFEVKAGDVAAVSASGSGTIQLGKRTAPAVVKSFVLPGK